MGELKVTDLKVSDTDCMCTQYRHEKAWKKLYAMELRDCEVCYIDWPYVTFHFFICFWCNHYCLILLVGVLLLDYMCMYIFIGYTYVLLQYL